MKMDTTKHVEPTAMHCSHCNAKLRRITYTYVDAEGKTNFAIRRKKTTQSIRERIVCPKRTCLWNEGNHYPWEEKGKGKSVVLKIPAKGESITYTLPFDSGRYTALKQGEIVY